MFVDLIRGIREEKKALKTISLTLSVGLGSRSLFQHHFLFLINEYIKEKKKKKRKQVAQEEVAHLSLV